MNPIAVLLEKWEREAAQFQADGREAELLRLAQRIVDLRAALANCSILEWHPGNERPREPGKYLGKFRGEFGSISFSVRYHGHRFWDSEDEEKCIEWAELPERN